MQAESKKATTGIEDRIVNCVWKINRDMARAELYRTDTAEIVETRDLTAAEMQLSMDDIVKALMERDETAEQETDTKELLETPDDEAGDE